LFDGPVDSVGEDVAVQVLAVLREALTNVARHASASRVDVEVVADGDMVLRVTDDGRGVPVELRAGGRGMKNMAARASDLGGTMLVKPGATGGTVLEWRVPAGGAR
ncbi:MAG TPA: ATP-binding protein, partial [Cryptosporangiaceae bacterium]|nr:ATP-binding protein [Cryptosporangiaceae bacterium]